MVHFQSVSLLPVQDAWIMHCNCMPLSAGHDENAGLSTDISSFGANDCGARIETRRSRPGESVAVRTGAHP